MGRPRPPVGGAGRSVTRSRAPRRATVSVTKPLVIAVFTSYGYTLDARSFVDGPENCNGPRGAA